MNNIEKYYEAITTGKIITSQRIIKTYERVLKGIKDGNFIYDIKKAQRPIKFIEEFCKQSQGVIGKEFKLMLWQKAMIEVIFGCINKKTGFRQFREAFVLCGRKNGKSSLLSGLALYMLVADKEGAAEIYSVATKLDQSKRIITEAWNMVRQSPSLKAILKKRRTDIYFPTLSSSMSALASTSRSMDGLNTHLGVIDECHAITDRLLYEQLKQSTQTRRQPLIFTITTAGTVRENIYDSLYDYSTKIADGVEKDETFVPFLYELDSENEWEDEKNWIKANPGLGEIKELKGLRDEVGRAKKDSDYMTGVLCKHFNIRQTGSQMWLSFEELNNEEKYDELKDRYCIGGADLSSTTDLTCATIITEKDNKVLVKQMYWIPEERLKSKMEEDKTPYDKWVERGYLRLCEGNTVNYHDVTNWFLEQVELGLRPLWVGYDSWNANYWKQEMETYGFEMVEVRQGAKTMSTPMKKMGADLVSKRVLYDNNPILKWCLSNTAIKTDENGNIRPIKGTAKRQRIDGAVSLLDAYVIYSDKYQDFKTILGE